MYQPVERRKEVVKEQQRDMEQAFERLFVDTHGTSTLSPCASFLSTYMYMYMMRPGIGRNASCALGDCLTSRP